MCVMSGPLISLCVTSRQLTNKIVFSRKSVEWESYRPISSFISAMIGMEENIAIFSSIMYCKELMENISESRKINKNRKIYGSESRKINKNRKKYPIYLYMEINVLVFA